MKPLCEPAPVLRPTDVARFILDHLRIGDDCHVRMEHWAQFNDTARELNMRLTRRAKYHNRIWLYNVTRTH